MVVLTADEAVELFRKSPLEYIPVEEGEVAYRRVGRGPDVLFVHGWPASGATYRGLLPYLTPHVTCHLIDQVGAGHSRFDRNTTISIKQHILSIQKVCKALKLKNYAVVGHNSGGMIARHAVAGDPQLRAMALINTEQPQGLNWRFKQFLWMSKIPGFTNILAWAGMKKGLRKNTFLLGGCFYDLGHLDGTFEEFVMLPLQNDLDRRWAAGQLIKSFEQRYVTELEELHKQIKVPVQLVWGEKDPFFPLKWACEMVSTFPNASLHTISQARLFSHEEHPQEVAQAILPVLSA